jgi:Ca-activated chloride channel family protein
MDYKLGGTSGQVPFSVATAERTDVPVVLDAGVLAITTPSDEYVEVFSASKDIAGNRTSFDYSYGPNFQTTLKAGDYIVLTEKNDVKTETPVTIKAGERFELTVEATETGKRK